MSTLDKLKEKYNLEIEAPFIIEISGNAYQFDCLIKKYGALNGMVIDSSWSKVKPVVNELIDSGYGFSCFDIHDSSVENFSEVLLDWGFVDA